MSKPRLLDLFCGAGGAAVGYARAGFDVVGVDIEFQPNYPFELHRGDALDFMGWFCGDEPSPARDCCTGHRKFDAIHASPPCPFHSSLNGWSGDTDSPNLIPETRELLQAAGLPYVIENVQGASLENPVRLCGSSFGDLGIERDGAWHQLRRHRLFESNFPIMVSPCQHRGAPVIVVGGSIGRKIFDPQRKAIAPTFEEALEAMGTPWMKRRREVVDAIPPRYTEHIGHYLKLHLEAEKPDPVTLSRVRSILTLDPARGMRTMTGA